MNYILPQLLTRLQTELGDFQFDGIFDTYGFEKNKGISIFKETWQRELDFHYEIQQNEDSPSTFYMRIDCHFHPYYESRGLEDDVYIRKYGEEKIAKRRELMQKTSKLIQKICSIRCTTHRTWQNNALWLAKWDLSSFDNIDAVV